MPKAKIYRDGKYDLMLSKIRNSPGLINLYIKKDGKCVEVMQTSINMLFIFVRKQKFLFIPTRENNTLLMKEAKKDPAVMKKILQKSIIRQYYKKQKKLQK